MTYSDVKKFVTSWRGMCILAVLVLAVLICVPAWQVERVRARLDKPDAYQLASLEDEYRRTLAQILAGCGLLVGLYWNSRRVKATEDNVRVAEEGHITERFTRAIAQLGDKENRAIRLGGIYALERLAKDSEKDYGPIMEVLTAYVRENATKQGKYAEEAAVKPTTDIQAILKVIGRRETTGKNRGNDRLDLSNTHLHGVVILRADLSGADLSGALLGRADLSGALLGGADLGGATLSGADLNGAFLERADLSGALLGRADLSGALLGGADLGGATLSGADLNGAFLERADLNGAFLDRADLSGALLSEATLSRAFLRGADLSEADLSGAGLGGADLTDADLREANDLTAEQVLSANFWREAHLPDSLNHLKDLPA